MLTEPPPSSALPHGGQRVHSPEDCLFRVHQAHGGDLCRAHQDLGGGLARRGGKEAKIHYTLAYVTSAPNYDIAASRFTLAESTGGQGFIHKAKLNNNGSFSVGKTWKLSELRGLEVLNVSA